MVDIGPFWHGEGGRDGGLKVRPCYAIRVRDSLIFIIVLIN